MVNPFKVDPTRTLTLRRNFVAEVKRRFRKLRKRVNDLIVRDDVFGLKDPVSFGLNTEGLTGNSRWRFETDEAKVANFKAWMREAMNDEILSVRPGGLPVSAPDFWTSGYIESAYRKGAVNSYLAAKRAGLGNLSFYDGTAEEFLSGAFNARVPVSKIKLISTRAFDQLQGITDAMSQTISRELSAAIAHGDGPREVAKRITSQIESIERKRALAMARTEIIHAHAEGQLDSFEAQDIDDIEVLAEISNAQDDRVCPLCQPLEGVVMTVKEARGLIPRHPNCRCNFLPTYPDDKRKGQKTTKKEIDSAISKSIRAERPGKSKKEAIADTQWVGADVKVAKKRPTENANVDDRSYILTVQMGGSTEEIEFRHGVITTNSSMKKMVDYLYRENPKITVNGQVYSGGERKLKAKCLRQILSGSFDVVTLQPKK
ncbi:MAG: hypothetical protein GY841_02825 [FCB group bacterium]|nr:hypothetical protein [FCB group bacterium]